MKQLGDRHKNLAWITMKNIGSWFEATSTFFLCTLKINIIHSLMPKTFPQA
jgi:hypothetical protein